MFTRLLKEVCFPLLQTYTILLTFFCNHIVSFDKKVLASLEHFPKEDLAKYSHQELRRLGIILLNNSMPRTSSFFFYKPRKDSKKIKFFTYFDCCMRLASVKASKKSTKGWEELTRRILGLI